MMTVAFVVQDCNVREMFPDAKWLDALKLPIKAKLSLALACGVLFYLFQRHALSFGALDPIVTTGLLIGVVVFSVLVAVDGLAWVAHPLAERRRSSLLTARRAARRKEQDEQREERRAAVLAQLDQLSRQEVRVLADALEAGSPTFYTYVYSPPVTMLQAKLMVWSPGGTHHQDHYPFSIADYVWEALQNRRDEFLEKERAFKAEEQANKRAGRANRW